MFLAQWLPPTNLAACAKTRSSSVTVSLLLHNSAAYGLKQELKFLERFFLFLILMSIILNVLFVRMLKAS